VGIDRHPRRSVIVRPDGTGKVLGTVRVDNDPEEFALAMAEAGEGPEVALGATYGYYCVADLLTDNGASVHPGPTRSGCTRTPGGSRTTC